MKSFTVVELLIIIGILIILAAIAVPAFRSFQKETTLNNSTEEVVAILRLAQNKTLASEGASQWGVYFENAIQPHQYTLFKGGSYATRDTAFDETHKLPSAVDIYNINLSGNEAVFSRVTGTANASGNLSLRLKNNPTLNKTVYIEETGRVSLTVPSTPSDADRVKDSRHLHFDLGWSIQNADTLKFDFVSASQIETVNMADYFNTDPPTEFNWNNFNSPFLVNGDNQIFKIHTHYLDSSDTTLCIHRDRADGDNTEEVRIYVIEGITETEIVHYFTDGTAQKGFNVNSMETQ